MTASQDKTDDPQVKRTEAVKTILERNRKFQPLTIGQVYYLMLEAGLTGRSMTDFVEVSAELMTAVSKGLLPTRALWTPTTDVQSGAAWDNMDDFIRAELDDLLWGYRRNLMQGQPRYVEIWIEPPQLVGFFSLIALDYCVTTVVCPRTPTPSFFNDLRRRLDDLPQPTPEVDVLYFGELDPARGGSLASLQEVLRTEGGFWELNLQRVAVTREMAIENKLPSRPDPGRSLEPHAAINPPGSTVVELEALAPKLLAGMIREAVEGKLDLQLLINQRAIQGKELTALARLRADILREIQHLLKK